MSIKPYELVVGSISFFKSVRTTRVFLPFRNINVPFIGSSSYHTCIHFQSNVKQYLAKKKTSVESLIGFNKITEALELFYEKPRQRDAESLILSESLSVENCLAVYNYIKLKEGINEKIIVAMLSICKDKKFSEKDKILTDTYDLVMSLQVGEKNSMNAFKWNTIITQFCDSTVYNTSRALNILNKAEEFGAIPSKYVIGALLLSCVNAELYKAVIDIFPKLEKYHIKLDVIHFNFYVKALAKMKYSNYALEALKKMESLNIKPDSHIYSTLISMCGETKQVEIGKLLHKTVQEKNLSNIYVDTSLIHMYCGFGMLGDASNIFYSLEKKDLVAWNAIIHGYGTNNQPKRSLELFQEMQQFKVAPDNQTFVCLLDACSVGGLLVEGFQTFRSMEREYCIMPDIRHYGCMVKLLLNENEYHLCLQLLREMREKNITPDETIQKLAFKKKQEDSESEELGDVINLINTP